MQRRLTRFLRECLPDGDRAQWGLELTLPQCLKCARDLLINHDLRWSKAARLPSSLAPAIHAQFATRLSEWQTEQHPSEDAECWDRDVHAPMLDVMTFRTPHVLGLQRELTAMTCALERHSSFSDQCLIDLVDSFPPSLMRCTLRQGKRMLRRIALSRVSVPIAPRPNNVPCRTSVQDIAHASASRHVDAVPSSQAPRDAGRFTQDALSSYSSRCARAPASARWMNRWSSASSQRRLALNTYSHQTTGQTTVQIAYASALVL